MKGFCQKCLIPLKKDTAPQSDIYCSCCFQNGTFTDRGSNLSEFKKQCYTAMTEKGMNKYLAKFYVFFISFAPYWKKNK